MPRASKAKPTNRTRANRPVISYLREAVVDKHHMTPLRIRVRCCKLSTRYRSCR